MNIITTIGLTKIATAIANATSIDITHMALGSSDRFPTGGEAALDTEIYRDLVSESGIVAGSPNEAYFKMTVPEDGVEPGFDYGPWLAQEIGLFDSDGDLIVIGRYPEPLPKYDPASGTPNSLHLNFRVIFANIAAINVSFTPDFNLPWATDEQARDPAVENRVVDPMRMHQNIAAGAFGDNVDRILFKNVYPTILNALGTCNVAVPAAGQIAFDTFEWMWRDFKILTTPTETLAHAASKIYHLKVKYDHATDAQTVTLHDVADVGYNPAAVPEWHRSLDASYDEIFVALLYTDAGNVATIVPYINMSILYAADDIPAVPGGLILDDTNPSDQTIDVTYTLNWARDCNAAFVGISDISEASVGGEYGFGIRSTRNGAHAWWGRTIANTDGVNMAFVARA